VTGDRSGPTRERDLLEAFHQQPRPAA
jgi:hypothetical protein